MTTPMCCAPGGRPAPWGGTVKAPSTLGTFLRSFQWGHVRQLDRVSRELLARAWQAGAGPGDGPLTIDLDSTICETYGLAKEGARHHGYTGKRGYHPLLAIAAGTGDVLMSRLREGRANTARGAAHFLRETVDDSRGPPPPEVAVGKHAAAPRQGTFQPLYGEPAPKALGAPTPGMDQLHHPLQVTQQHDEHRRRQSEKHCRFKGCPRQPDHVVRKAISAGAQQRRDQGYGQVVGYAGGYGGQLGQEGHHEVAEVVVTDRVARQPGVLGREEPALEYGIEEGEVHGLLRVVDGGREGNHREPDEVEAQEDQLGGDQGDPFSAHEGKNLREVAPRHQSRGHRHHRKDQEDAVLGVGQYVGQTQHPQQIGPKQQPQQLREDDASIGQASKETKG